jgi:NAD/NADP transhydrogenase beta subunit
MGAETTSFLDSAIMLLYLVATSFFILGIKRLGSAATARSGNQLAAIGMLLGVAVTLFDQQILRYEWIVAGMVLGGLIGAVLARSVAMTSMPELVALFNGLGGAASALVAWGEWERVGAAGLGPDALVTIGLSLLIGSITLTGSLMAFGKLNGFIIGKLITFPAQNVLTVVLMVGMLVASGLFAWNSSIENAFLDYLGGLFITRCLNRITHWWCRHARRDFFVEFVLRARSVDGWVCIETIHYLLFQGALVELLA